MSDVCFCFLYICNVICFSGFHLQVNCAVNRQAIQCLADLVTEANNSTISEILYMM